MEMGELECVPFEMMMDVLSLSVTDVRWTSAYCSE